MITCYNTASVYVYTKKNEQIQYTLENDINLNDLIKFLEEKHKDNIKEVRLGGNVIHIRKIQDY